MKKNFLFLSMVLIAMLNFFSCSSDNDDEHDDISKNGVNFNELTIKNVVMNEKFSQLTITFDDSQVKISINANVPDSYKLLLSDPYRDFLKYATEIIFTTPDYSETFTGDLNSLINVSDPIMGQNSYNFYLSFNFKNKYEFKAEALPINKMPNIGLLNTKLTIDDAQTILESTVWMCDVDTKDFFKGFTKVNYYKPSFITFKNSIFSYGDTTHGGDQWSIEYNHADINDYMFTLTRKSIATTRYYRVLFFNTKEMSISQLYRDTENSGSNPFTYKAYFTPYN